MPGIISPGKFIPHSNTQTLFLDIHKKRQKFESRLASILSDSQNKTLYPDGPTGKISVLEAQKYFTLIESVRRGCFGLLGINNKEEQRGTFKYHFLDKPGEGTSLVVHPGLVGGTGNYLGLLENISIPTQVLDQCANIHNPDFEITLKNQIAYVANFVTNNPDQVAPVLYGTSVGGEIQLKVASELVQQNTGAVRGVVVVGGSGILEEVMTGSGRGILNILGKPYLTSDLIRQQFYNPNAVPPEVVNDIYRLVSDGDIRKGEVFWALKIGRKSTQGSLKETLCTRDNHGDFGSELSKNPTLQAYKTLYDNRIPVCILHGKYDKIVSPIVPAIVLFYLGVIDETELRSYQATIQELDFNSDLTGEQKTTYDAIFREIEQKASTTNGLVTVNYFKSGHTPDIELPRKTASVIQDFTHRLPLPSKEVI